jgi:hypothetical protein
MLAGRARRVRLERGPVGSRAEWCVHRIRRRRCSQETPGWPRGRQGL